MSDLAELFARDPLKLTREDVGTIVERLRAARTQFLAGIKGAGKVKESAKAAKATENKAAAEELLKTLDL